MEKAILFLVLDAISREHNMSDNQQRIESIRAALEANDADAANDQLEAVNEHLATRAAEAAKAKAEAAAADESKAKRAKK